MTKPIIQYAGGFCIVKHPDSNMMSVEIAPEAVPQFKELLRRAMNCWPDASPHLKEMHDLVRYDKILQNYHVQQKKP